ncbi:DUF7860 family protein [Halocatena halophila]|uniref:DUF7860 family protein n=1 Tax=Halocatena halophila TaxID=2814576 RepID=UPI002ED447FC
MTHGSTVNHELLVKLGFSVGVGLFVLGAAGQGLLPAITGPLPSWEQSLLLGAEEVGLVVGFFSPFVFGILLPLIE